MSIVFLNWVPRAFHGGVASLSAAASGVIPEEGLSVCVRGV